MTTSIKKHHHRHRPRRHKHTGVGTAPGTLSVHPDANKSRISLIAYGPDDVAEFEEADLMTIEASMSRWPVTWVNVAGLGDLETIKSLGDFFHLHGLALEDVLSLHQHGKIEQYSDHLFVVIHMIDSPPGVKTEQLNMFVGARYILTFQDSQPGDCLEPVRKRIRDKSSRVRAERADYLAYSLMDAVIDAYFPHLDEISDRIDALETEVVENPKSETVAHLHDLRHDLLAIRRMISPLREVVNALIRDTGADFSDTTRLYLRDCYDHTVHVLDIVETYREIVSGLLDVYLSSVSNRLNEIMKVLAIITALFIPLSFLAGVYGMNFHTEASPLNMPELSWYWGYPLFLGLCATIIAFQLYLFRKKGWLGRRTTKTTKGPDP